MWILISKELNALSFAVRGILNLWAERESNPHGQSPMVFETTASTIPPPAPDNSRLIVLQIKIESSNLLIIN